jgi:hypothetical protein
MRRITLPFCHEAHTGRHAEEQAEPYGQDGWQKRGLTTVECTHEGQEIHWHWEVSLGSLSQSELNTKTVIATRLD